MLLNRSCLEHSYSSQVFIIMKRVILEANGVSMAMMAILRSDICNIRIIEPLNLL